MNTRLFLGTAAILFGSSIMAQNAKDAKGLKQGPWERTWAGSSQLRYKGQFKDDKPVGLFAYFSTLGKTESTVDHYAGSDASHARHFHPDGKLMAEGRYVGEAKDSTWNYYDVDGHLRSTENWKGGKKNGASIALFANGKTAETCAYSNNQRTGECKTFFDNGQLKTIATYVKDEPEGVMTFYYPSGKKEIEGKCVNGDRDGGWIYYNDDGSIQLQMLYRQGEFVKDKKENGVFKEYFDDEQLKNEITWKNGKREGAFSDYFDNGHYLTQPMKLGPDGAEVPDNERTLEGQTKKREGTYKNDSLDGDVKEYDEKGKLRSTTHYLNGQVAPKP